MTQIIEFAICPICSAVHPHGKLSSGKLFLSPEQVEQNHDLLQGATHFAWCLDCEEKILLGYLAIIEIDEELSTETMPYKTSRMLWLRARAFEDLFDSASFLEANKKKAVYMVQD